MPRHVVIHQYILDPLSDLSSERQVTTLFTYLILQYIDAKGLLADHSTITTSDLLLSFGARPYYVADMRRSRWPASTSTDGCSCVYRLESNGVHHHNIRLSHVRGRSVLSSSLKVSSLAMENG